MDDILRKIGIFGSKYHGLVSGGTLIDGDETITGLMASSPTHTFIQKLPAAGQSQETASDGRIYDNNLITHINAGHLIFYGGTSTFAKGFLCVDENGDRITLEADGKLISNDRASITAYGPLFKYRINENPSPAPSAIDIPVNIGDVYNGEQKDPSLQPSLKLMDISNDGRKSLFMYHEYDIYYPRRSSYAGVLEMTVSGAISDGSLSISFQILKYKQQVRTGTFSITKGIKSFSRTAAYTGDTTAYRWQYLEDIGLTYSVDSSSGGTQQKNSDASLIIAAYYTTNGISYKTLTHEYTDTITASMGAYSYDYNQTHNGSGADETVSVTLTESASGTTDRSISGSIKIDGYPLLTYNQTYNVTNTTSISLDATYESLAFCGNAGPPPAISQTYSSTWVNSKTYSKLETNIGDFGESHSSSNTTTYDAPNGLPCYGDYAMGHSRMTGNDIFFDEVTEFPIEIDVDPPDDNISGGVELFFDIYTASAFNPNVATFDIGSPNNNITTFSASGEIDGVDQDVDLPEVATPAGVLSPSGSGENYAYNPKTGDVVKSLSGIYFV